MEVEDGEHRQYLLELDSEEIKDEDVSERLTDKEDEFGEDYADDHAKNPTDVLIDLLEMAKGGQDYYARGSCKECDQVTGSVQVKSILMPEPIEVPKQWGSKTFSMCKPKSLVEWEKKNKIKQGGTSKGKMVGTHILRLNGTKLH